MMPNRNQTNRNKGIIAALDIGSQKTVAVIARAEIGGAHVLGYGISASAGIKNGNIIEMEPVSVSILDAIDQAEKMADCTIDSVLVNIPGNLLSSRLVVQARPLASHYVTDEDINQILTASGKTNEQEDWQVVQMIPTAWAIDGSRGIRDPRGMHGEILAAHMNIISAPQNAIKTLDACVARCHLDIQAMVPAPFAAGIASVLDDERTVGAIAIDMGAGVTSAAVFINDALVHVASVPLGGRDITIDIATGISTSIVLAEELKLLYGEAERPLIRPEFEQYDDTPAREEFINAPCLGEDRPREANAVSRSWLTGIIQLRIEEIFEKLRDELIAAGFYRAAGRRVVLSGGGSNLPGVRDVASRIFLEKSVRLGRPLSLRAAPEILIEPQFTVIAGLIAYGMRPLGARVSKPAVAQNLPNFFGNFGQWVRERF
ncbi:MAG: cell division protein FtsA [Alphaproteobacteria bacterium]|nr:cell division protein FtsA [Alphaproteobacteria bacterium]